MLYSEFIERTGASVSAELYHKCVEPNYYDYPGDKDEFCRDWIAEHLVSVADSLRKFQKRRNEIVPGSQDEFLYGLAKTQFKTLTLHLTALVEKLSDNHQM